ncbi:DnaD domain-containing protein [Lacticaseibacillus thailandensis]|uniref:Primosome component related protein n=1 Tax=Lacticaseibacillus thailandensis DSM 22698 = JCM 13996 TaxID=1423810 RepID=A0A0R2C9R4_9LACO|nr:DnaD domain protein [Lacticaseibacillus thailandensis]KRM88112.1 primosome component related protein [Lacticaseibacillus thailandensis DSM 22698 = JCM 13996]
MSSIDDLLTAGSTSFSDLLFSQFAASSLTRDELLAYLYIDRYVQHHRDAPNLQALAQATKMTTTEFNHCVANLVSKGAITISTGTDARGRMTDVYDTKPLIKHWLTNAEPAADHSAGAPAATTVDPVRHLQQQVETEFGRMLTPIEQQTIRAWLNEDHYDPEVVALALREAVLNQAYSLKYMDRVLITWEKRNLRTVQAIKQAQREFNEL